MPGKNSYASPTALDHTLIHPEGCAREQGSDTAILANQSQVGADDELWARDETGERDQILASGRFEAGHRQDITLTAVGGSTVRVVRSGTPFSLQLAPSAPPGRRMKYARVLSPRPLPFS